MNEPTEIELKYLVKNNFDLSDLILYLRSNGFNATSIKFVINEDYYFDTPNKDLLKNGGSLRIRKTKKGPIKGTFKYPIDNNDVYTKRMEILKKSLFKHMEIEKTLTENSYTELMNRFNDLQYDLNSLCPFPVLKINNQRQEITLTKDNNCVVVAFDTIIYDNKKQEHMLEIELKEGPNPNILIEIDKLIQERFNLELTKQSKYQRGIEQTKLVILTRKHS